eukprot:TRINITY_DN97128_c0_g1_i1.p2 TRINITY_DN97128_c0_g1~~TRINITY_DN97128_c0_g1_i1.p2  ORF type:complete len:164 (+),score=32.32 TRINITY_DN97128_c0_g1_i1:68-559(+)
MPNLHTADSLSDALAAAVRSSPGNDDTEGAALQAVAKAAQAAETLRGIVELDKVNTWVAANPFFRSQFVSGYHPDVVESYPNVFGTMARTNPRAAWHAAEAVRLAAEDHLPGGDLYHHADGSTGPDLAQKFMVCPDPSAVGLLLPRQMQRRREQRKRPEVAFL